MDNAASRFQKRFPQLAIQGDKPSSIPSFELKVNEFKDMYSNKFQLFAAAEKAFRNLVQLLVSLLDIEEPKVTSRIKDRDECIEKFKYKYKNDLEQKGNDYTIINSISDIIGVRVICLYEADIPLVEEIIRKHFDVIGVTDKTSILLSAIRAFGYKGLHFDLKLNAERKLFPEYERFSEMQFELQVRTIVQDAWSEVDHKLKYKKQIPDLLQRRIIRLSALFELADQEFVAIRNETEALERAAIEKAVEQSQSIAKLNELDAAKYTDIVSDDSHKSGSAPAPLDSFTFLTAMKKRHPNYKFEAANVDGFVDEIKRGMPNLTADDFEKALNMYYSDVWDYKQMKRIEGVNMNPYTDIRHVLYVAYPQELHYMLNPKQAAAFIDWWNTDSEPVDGDVGQY